MKPFEFINRIKRVNELKRTLPSAVGQMAVNHFRANFKKQGFDDNGVTPWKKRKKRDNSFVNTLAYVSKKYRTNRAILVDTTNLRRSIKVNRATFDKIRISSDTKYGKIHNEGGTIKHPGGTPYIIGSDGMAIFMKKDGSYPAGVKFTEPHDIKIPQRKFMGESESLKKKIVDKVTKEIKKALLGR